MANTPLQGGNVVNMSRVIDPQTGKPSYEFLRWLMDAQTRIQAGLNELGELLGTFSGTIASGSQVQGRSETIGVTLQHITATGQLNSLTSVASDVDLDHIADTASYVRTTPNEASGAAQAYTALVASGPISGKALVYNGTSWQPQNVSWNNVSGTPTLPATTAASPHEWLNSYDASTGNFTQSQPAYSDLTGTPVLPITKAPNTHQWIASYDATTGLFTGGQPSFGDLSGSLLASQVPVSFGSGAPSALSTEGYIYFDTSVTPYQGYVYHSSAWNKFA